MKHGLSNTPFYRVWTNMKSRCYYHKDKKFKHYGGRGITVCDRWLSFLKFRDDMYSNYIEHKAMHKTTTIDRTNNDGNYCPENCCWATKEEQMHVHLPNVTDTVFIMKQYQTIKIWKETLSKLRLLAGMREQSIVKILDKLIGKALEKYEKEKTRVF